MTMDDDKLKNIFHDFDPVISSDIRFMDKLQRNLNAVEIVRQQNRMMLARNKRAVVIAAMAGFLVGLIFSFALPYIGDMIAGLRPTLDVGSVGYILADNYQLITWLIIGAVSVFTSLNTYELVLSIIRKPA